MRRPHQSVSGAAGNRTPVLERRSRSSPGAVSVVAFLGPGARTDTSPTGPVTKKSRSILVTGIDQQVSLMRPGSGTETDARSDRFGHRSGGEGEATALSVGSYWFPAIVYEMTLAPRPASPGTNVPSRNRSAPLELSTTVARRGQSTGSTAAALLLFRESPRQRRQLSKYLTLQRVYAGWAASASISHRCTSRP